MRKKIVGGYEGRNIVDIIKSQRLILSAIILFFFLISMFGVLAYCVHSGASHAFDESLLAFIKKAEDVFPPAVLNRFEQIMRDLSALGGVAVLTLITVLSVFYFIMSSHKRRAVYILAAIITATVLGRFLKWGFDRPRPDFISYETIAFSSSFPSGHSLRATVVYLTLGVILANAAQNRHMKIFYLSAAGLIASVVGISRIYLGVHWPSDVIAGWLIGCALVVLLWILMKVWRMRFFLT